MREMGKRKPTTGILGDEGSDAVAEMIAKLVS